MFRFCKDILGMIGSCFGQRNRRQNPWADIELHEHNTRRIDLDNISVETEIFTLYEEDEEIPIASGKANDSHATSMKYDATSITDVSHRYENQSNILHASFVSVDLNRSEQLYKNDSNNDIQLIIFNDSNLEVNAEPDNRSVNESNSSKYQSCETDEVLVFKSPITEHNLSQDWVYFDNTDENAKSKDDAERINEFIQHPQDFKMNKMCFLANNEALNETTEPSNNQPIIKECIETSEETEATGSNAVEEPENSKFQESGYEEFLGGIGQNVNPQFSPNKDFCFKISEQLP
ncbi:uncharacterized protein LOC119679525 [Teleopsis dalmanni]|uniref:uncharacterized protein LOC119679525 n=1 Tax=Teleopsis dalmanni TaxID=139649 RepID=UPI0018CEC76B|nr:uncharacterized protein LOC119679525 [Teleopsis dalmanni]